MIKTSWRDKKFRLTIVLALLGVAGAAVILYGTPWGIGLNHDSLFYVGGAESILRGQGFSYNQLGEVRTIIKWPPLYSLALSFFGLLGMSMVEAGRWLNALLAGINIVFVGGLVYAKTTRLWPAIIASFLVLASSDTIAYATMALTEPLYISCGLAALYFLDKYIDSASVYSLIIAALFVAAAAMTRYVGVTLAATACISILIFSKRAPRRRLVDCIIAGLISSLPLLLWQIRNRLATRHETPLASGAELFKVELQPHIVEARHLKTALPAISGWLLPPPTPMSLQIACVVVVVLGTLFLVVWSRREGGLALVYLHLCYVVIYCLGLVLFTSFASLDIYLDARYLVPVFVSVLLIVTVSVSRIARNANFPVRIAITAFCVLLCVSYVQRAIPMVQRFHKHGRWYESPMWTQSEPVRLIRNLPEDARVYANLPIAAIFLTQRQTYAVPLKMDPNSEIPVADYSQRLDEISLSSQSRRTLLFYTALQSKHYPTEDELKQRLSLQKIGSSRFATLYEVLPQRK